MENVLWHSVTRMRYFLLEFFITCLLLVSTEAYHDHLLAHTLSNIEDGPSTASNNLNDSLLAKVTQEEEDGSIKNGSNSLESDGLLAQRLQYVERKKKEEKEFKKLQVFFLSS